MDVDISVVIVEYKGDKWSWKKYNLKTAYKEHRKKNKKTLSIIINTIVRKK